MDPPRHTEQRRTVAPVATPLCWGQAGGLTIAYSLGRSDEA